MNIIKLKKHVEKGNQNNQKAERFSLSGEAKAFESFLFRINGDAEI